MVKVTSITKEGKEHIINHLDDQLGNLNPYNPNHLKEAKQILNLQNQFKEIPIRED